VTFVHWAAITDALCQAMSCDQHRARSGFGLLESFADRWPASGEMVLLARGSNSDDGTARVRHETGEPVRLHLFGQACAAFLTRQMTSRVEL
jgi:hypothetical protein